MKRLLFIAALLSWTGSVSAQGLVPKPIPCFEPKVYTPASSPGSNPHIEFKSYNCVDIFGPLPAGGPNVIEKGRTEIVAGKYVRFGPGTHIGPLPDPVTPESDPHVFHAYIGENDFEVVWFEPNSTPGYVGQYEKLELGVKLPYPLDSMVYYYVHHTIGSPLEWMNPFDPEMINVEAEFSYNGETYNAYSPEFTKKVYGFYYREFNQPTITDSAWVEDTTSYPFRIRFAPTAIGQWTAKIKIETPVGDYECLPITFECVPSENPGFVKVGENKSYFKLGNETFVPVGQNLFSPYEMSDPDFYEFENYNPREIKPRGYFDYKSRMEWMAESGGNYFRMIIAAPGTEIEFEKLGDYSDRMDNAWEMDKILDKAKELNLYIHYNLQIHYSFENASVYNMYYWDWKTNSTDNRTDWLCELTKKDSGYCYNAQVPLSNPVDFFSNSTAKTHYKNRIRYLVSRYGYSTNIALYELFSEIDNVGQGRVFEPDFDGGEGCPGGNPCCKGLPDKERDYWKDSPQGIAAAQATAEWQKDMAEYIKDNLDDDNHLIAANYTGGPNASERQNLNIIGESIWGPDVNHDDTYSDANIDVMALNFYGTHINRFKNAYDQIFYRHLINQKPLMFSEIGGDAEGCSHYVEWLRQEWIAPFIGAAGAGIPWSRQYNDSLWHYYGMIHDFIEGYNFADEDWVPVHDIRDDGKSEVYALVSENKNKCIGVIINRTVNFFTANQGSTTWCGDIDNAAANGVDSDLDDPNIVTYNDAFANDLKIDLEPGDYIVDYYSGIDGGFINDDNETVLLGKINLQHEPLIPPGSGNPAWIMPFKAYKSVAKNLTISPDSSIVKDIPVKRNLNRIMAVPNPAVNQVTISVDLVCDNQYLQIYSSTGQCLLNTKMTDRKMTIDTKEFQNGIYTIIVRSDNELLFEKIIIQK